MLRILTAAIFGLALLSTASATEREDLTPLMHSLMTWASPITGYPAPDNVPRVRFADRCDIEHFVYPDAASRECDPDASGVQAAYDHHSKTLFLQTGWSPQNLFDVSAMLHELIHHMQAEVGLNLDTVKCAPEELERPAYDAQIEWLKATGVDPFKTIGINGLFYVIVTSCGWDK